MDATEPPPPTWVSVAEAAEKSGVGTSTVRQWYRSGRIPTQRAEGDRGKFLVPLDAVLALADLADEEGDDLGAAVIDLNASYWSDQTEAAREEAAEAKRALAQVQADLAEAEAEIDEFEAELTTARAERDEATAQLESLRSQLDAASGDARSLAGTTDALASARDRSEAEAADLRAQLDTVRRELAQVTDERDALQARIGLLQEELTELRAVTKRAGSITDTSWIDAPTNSYRSPVRPQGMAAADALSGLLAATTADRPATVERRDEDEVEAGGGRPKATGAGGRATPAPTMFDDVDRRKAAAARTPIVDPKATPVPAADATPDEPVAEGGAGVDDETWAAERRAAALDFGFGEHDDDLLPEPEKKPKRGRR